MEEKVVGTTFVTQKPIEELTGRLVPAEEGSKGVSEFHTTALLVAEPTNPYDHTAVGVIVRGKDGSAIRVGYLPKQSAVKETLNGLTACELIIYLYSEIGMTDSYRVEITN